MSMIDAHLKDIKDEPTRIALQLLVNAVNLLSDKRIERSDTVFRGEGIGPVVKNPDNGLYYRISVTGTATQTITASLVGTNPTGE
jgi:hypothetical protein